MEANLKYIKAVDDNCKVNEDYIDIECEEPEEYETGKKKILGLRGLIIGIVIAMICVGSIGGYSVYNTTTMKYDTGEMVNRLNDMQGELDTLSDSVSQNRFILSQVDMRNENMDEFSGGIIGKLIELDTYISSTKKDINDLLGLINSGVKVDDKTYDRIVEKYNEIQDNIIYLNGQMDVTLVDISTAIERLEDTNDINTQELLSSLKTVKDDLTEANNSFEAKVEDRLYALSGGVDQLESSISKLYISNENQYETIVTSLNDNIAELQLYLDSKNNTLIDNYDAGKNAIIENVDTKYAYLDELIRSECAKVFQRVTKVKFDMVSALAKKYDMVDATWSVNGYDVNAILEDAKRNSQSNEEMYEYVAEQVSFNDICEAAGNLPMEILITTSYEPGEIIYHKHYHTDGDGNRVDAESVLTEVPAGGCFSVGVHNHTESCFQAGYCPETAVRFWRGETKAGGWGDEYRCPLGHVTGHYTSTFGELYYGIEQPCNHPITQIVCGGQPYNEYKAGCGYGNGQVMSAEIIWEECDTGGID